MCIKAINEHLDLNINNRDIDRTHRTGHPRNTDEKARPIIIKLVRYNDRKKTLGSKKKLKGKKIGIAESLKVYAYEKVERGKCLDFRQKNFIQGWVGQN